VNIKPETLKSRAYRIQQENGSNEPNDSTHSNDSGNKDNKEISKGRRLLDGEQLGLWYLFGTF